ncbi:MAG: 3-methyl-2-oxobutanoate dehydrogenase subunit VorB [Lentisphaeria bacterium]
MTRTQLAKGNSACVIGALYAGCECFFGYPITPASEITHEASSAFPQLGRVFLQAESETASINMLYGAAAAGRRAMTGSSGPGISLMQEGFSYLAGAELPCVVVDIVRAGPGLGNIGPEQSDYNQMVKGGGHGNYHNIVLAPASVQEMCDFTYQAFDLAFKYRNPAVVMADAVLGQMMEPLKLPEKAITPPDISSVPWAVSGTAATRENVVTSILLDFDELEEHNCKLEAKYARMQQEEGGDAAENYLTDDAELIIAAYGSSSRIAHSAVDALRAEGIPVGLFRPKSLFPFPDRQLQELAQSSDRQFLVVEMSNGQFRDDIRLKTECHNPVHLLSRYGGNLISVEETIDKVKEILA